MDPQEAHTKKGIPAIKNAEVDLMEFMLLTQISQKNTKRSLHFGDFDVFRAFPPPART